MKKKNNDRKQRLNIRAIEVEGKYKDMEENINRKGKYRMNMEVKNK